MTAEHIRAQLEVVRNKGNCIRTVRRAETALKSIKPFISDKEYTEISIALSHVELGEGTDELNSILKRIIIS